MYMPIDDVWANFQSARMRIELDRSRDSTQNEVE